MNVYGIFEYLHLIDQMMKEATGKRYENSTFVCSVKVSTFTNVNREGKKKTTTTQCLLQRFEKLAKQHPLSVEGIFLLIWDSKKNFIAKMAKASFPKSTMTLVACLKRGKLRHIFWSWEGTQHSLVLGARGPCSTINSKNFLTEYG